MEGRLVLGELGDTGPRAFGWCSHDAENPDYLVFVGSSGKEGSTSKHLGHDTSGRPDIDASIVGPASQQDIGSTIPEGNDFVGEGVDRNAKGTSQTKITKLENTLAVDEEVLGFEIAVKHTILVAEVDALEQLIHEGFDGGRLKSTTFAMCIHISLEISIHEFEDEHQFVLGVDNIMECDNVLVLEFFHKRNLADRCRWGSLLGI